MDDREWATVAFDALAQGRSVQVRPRGHSMRGKINDGDSITLEPCRAAEVMIGDIVLARVRGWLLVLHQVLDRNGDQFLIGTTAGRVDGWVLASDIFGKVTRIEAAG